MTPILNIFSSTPLTQEVVYNGLLKNQRQEIHERIGVALEVLFRHRLSELHEILAYHFSRSNNYEKAIGYLVKAGEKSLKMHSLDEANDYFSEAIKIYRSMPDRNRKMSTYLKLSVNGHLFMIIWEILVIY